MDRDKKIPEAVANFGHEFRFSAERKAIAAKTEELAERLQELETLSGRSLGEGVISIVEELKDLDALSQKVPGIDPPDLLDEIIGELWNFPDIAQTEIGQNPDFAPYVTAAISAFTDGRVDESDHALLDAVQKDSGLSDEKVSEILSTVVSTHLRDHYLRNILTELRFTREQEDELDLLASDLSTKFRWDETTEFILAECRRRAGG